MGAYILPPGDISLHHYNSKIQSDKSEFIVFHYLMNLIRWMPTKLLTLPPLADVVDSLFPPGVPEYYEARTVYEVYGWGRRDTEQAMDERHL